MDLVVDRLRQLRVGRTSSLESNLDIVAHVPVDVVVGESGNHDGHDLVTRGSFDGGAVCDLQQLELLWSHEVVRKISSDVALYVRLHGFDLEKGDSLVDVNGLCKARVVDGNEEDLVAVDEFDLFDDMLESCSRGAV